jgi:hypothetical protein
MTSLRGLGFGVFTAATIAAALAGGRSFAQSPTAPPTTKPATGEAPAIEPGVLEALDKMGTHLRTLNMFTLQVDATLDEVLLSGQKLQFGGRLTYKYRKPNGLFLNQDTDRQQRQFFFDGKTFTLYSPRMHYYASAPAPATVRELISDLQTKFGIELPVADLFLWGTDAAKVSAIKTAIDVGPARINGAVCEQFAFRQEGVDWQLWIRQGDKPLPCRLVITTTDDDAKPQYAATFTWDTSTPVPESAFTFTAPKDARRIRFATMDATADAAKEQGHVQ